MCTGNALTALPSFSVFVRVSARCSCLLSFCLRWASSSSSSGTYIHGLTRVARAVRCTLSLGCVFGFCFFSRSFATCVLAYRLHLHLLHAVHILHSTKHLHSFRVGIGVAVGVGVGTTQNNIDSIYIIRHNRQQEKSHYSRQVRAPCHQTTKTRTTHTASNADKPTHEHEPRAPRSRRLTGARRAARYK